jgi:hypothetical protein
MPAPASSPIHAVCAQLATQQIPDPVAALPGQLDLLAGVADPRARRGGRHRVGDDPGGVDLRGDRPCPIARRDRGMGR